VINKPHLEFVTDAIGNRDDIGDIGNRQYREYFFVMVA
jgi:hypothetical protein